MFSLLLVLFAIIGLSLLFFMILILVSSPKKSNIYIDDEHGIEIVKVVEAHRKILPVCSVQGWSLVSSAYGLRCWMKELTLKIMGAPLTVYGCTKPLNCSAVIVLNVIADISTWPEWDVWAEGQTVHLEVSEDPSLHGDRYMQCDQLVVTNNQTKSDVVMYRFGNLERNGVGWILLWNVKRLEWTFYIAQPVSGSSSDSDGDITMDKCLLTAITGSDSKSTVDKTLADKLCAKVQNLSDAIATSYLKVRPLQPLIKSTSSTLNNPHFPAIHSALSDLPEKPCVLLKLEKIRQLNILRNCALAVVPAASEKSGRAIEFQLVSRLLKDTFNGSLFGEAIIVSDEKRRSRRRHKNRSDSVASNAPVNKRLLIEQRRSSSLSAPVARRRLPELTVTEVDDDLKPPTRAASHSFLDMIFSRRRSSDGSDRKGKSPSQSRCSTPPPEKSPPPERNLKKSNRLSSASSQEDLPQEVFISSALPINKVMESKEKRENIPSDITDSDVILDRKVESCDYKVLGDLCISSLLKESAKVSLVDINTPEEEQRKLSYGWMFKEMNKDVTVFKKVSSVRGFSVISYMCKGLIPCSNKTVWKTLCNPMTRFMYDDTVKKISVLQELPSGQKLIHMYHESVSLLRKEIQDFCILQTAKEKDNQMVLAFHSVDDPVCPPMKDVSRGTVLTSGWIVEKVPEIPHATMISYLMQMIASSPDSQVMEEISNIQCQCINNLSTYLASKPL